MLKCEAYRLLVLQHFSPYSGRYQLWQPGRRFGIQMGLLAVLFGLRGSVRRASEFNVEFASVLKSASSQSTSQTSSLSHRPDPLIALRQAVWPPTD
ncbi:hypothetical protein D918_05752 [Trichuris suis]|nr:hypothetical protein D918_05752 [Trichuris suis]